MTATPRIPLVYSGRIRRAMQLAERVHRGQARASGDYPYFLHPFAVVEILIAADADDDLIIAGLLHDAVEDTALTSSAVEDEFGANVAALVEAVTKRKVTGMRKAEINRIVEEKMSVAPVPVVALKGADLLANISDLILDQRKLGYSHWERLFKNRARADGKITHYLRLAAIIITRLQDAAAFPVIEAHLRTRAGDLQLLYDEWVRER